MPRQQVKLSDGVTLTVGADSSTGIRGAAYSPDFARQHPDRPFIGAVSRSYMKSQDRRAADYPYGGGSSFHVGHFSDPREAAYAAAAVARNPGPYLDRWVKNGGIDGPKGDLGPFDFPPDLYTAIPAPDLKDIQNRHASRAAQRQSRSPGQVAQRRASSGPRASRAPQPINQIDLNQEYGPGTIQKLRSKFGDQVVKDYRSGMSIQDFEEKYIQKLSDQQNESIKRFQELAGI